MMHTLGTIALWAFAALGAITMVKAILRMARQPRPSLRQRLYTWLVVENRPEKASDQAEVEWHRLPEPLPQPPAQRVTPQRHLQASRTRPGPSLPPAPAKVPVFNDIGRPGWAVEDNYEDRLTTVQ